MAFAGMMMTIMGQPIETPPITSNSFTFNNPVYTANVSLSTYINPTGLYLRPNGERIGYFNDAGAVHDIVFLPMSTNYDITTAGTAQTSTPSSTNGRALVVDNDGLKAYYIQALAGTDRLREDIFSQAWNTSGSATLTSNVNISLSLQGSAIGSTSGLTFVSNSTANVFIISGDTGELESYSAPNYPTIFGLSSRLNGVSVGSRIIKGLASKPDGTKLYGLDDDNSNIVEWNMTTAGDITTLTEVSNKSLQDILGVYYPSTTDWQGMTIDRTNGDYLYIINAGAGDEKIFQITLSG